MQAAGSGDCQMMELLIGNGARVDEPGRFQDTALMSAITGAGVTGKLDGVKCLIGLGANVNAHMRGGNTILMQSVWTGDPSVVKILLDAGADPLAQTECGDTADDMAAKIADAGIKDKHTDEIRQLLHARSGKPPSSSRSQSKDDDCGCSE
jgi:ankyrin repeat protein